ncbi:MAG: hypothetical protein RDV41_09580, partial [Planctomycetota bacterium]|nr:hypothetical protein [Planctomycetota bacterium]
AANVAKLSQRAQIRQAFNTLSLRVVGIVYHVIPQTEPMSLSIELFQRTLPIRMNLKTWISASEAIIAAGGKDQPVKDGSVVDIAKDTGVTVFRIEPGAVLFQYRDEIIRVPLAR